MESDSSEKNNRYTLRVGCGGCILYIILFATVGSVMLAYQLPSMLSVPILAFFVILWFLGFIWARKMDTKNNEKRY